MTRLDSTTQQLVAVLGRGVLPSAGTAIVTADDLGLTRGDGCFDATRVRTDAAGVSRADDLAAHLDRFTRSAAALGLTVDRTAWSALIDDALAGWRAPGEATLKLMLTRGAESATSAVTGIATITAATTALLAQRRGIAVATLDRGYSTTAFADAPWLLGGVKSLSYAVNAAAKREANARGADDALFLSTDGYVLEAPTSAIVASIDGTLVSTPTGPTGILASITLAVAFAAAAGNNVATAYRLMRLPEVTGADAAWLLSSVRGVAPIRRIDDVTLPERPDLDDQVRRLANCPGPVTGPPSTVRR